MRLRELLPLLRLRLVPSALIDPLTGFALAGTTASLPEPFVLLRTVLAASAFYCGGMVLNDCCDRDRDRVLRPERPLPSGKVPAPLAWILAALLLALAVWLTPPMARAWIALPLLSSIVLYDTLGSRILPLGMVLLPACRILNVLLGFVVVTGEFLPGTSGIVVCACYGLYIAVATLHGRIEDRPATGRILRISRGCLSAAAVLAIVAALLLAHPILGAIALLPVCYSLLYIPKSSAAATKIPARTGLLLRNIGRFGATLVVGASGIAILAALALSLAYVPAMLWNRRIRSWS